MNKKTTPPSQLIQLPIWKDGLGILDTDTQEKFLKSKRSLENQYSLERSHIKSIELNA